MLSCLLRNMKIVVCCSDAVATPLGPRTRGPGEVVCEQRSRIRCPEEKGPEIWVRLAPSASCSRILSHGGRGIKDLLGATFAAKPLVREIMALPVRRQLFVQLPFPIVAPVLYTPPRSQDRPTCKLRTIVYPRGPEPLREAPRPSFRWRSCLLVRELVLGLVDEPCSCRL
jgi:hypothetical protein